LGRKAVKTKWLAAVGLFAVGVNVMGFTPLAVLAISAIIAGAAALIQQHEARASILIPFAVPSGLAAVATAVFVPVSIVRLFFSFLKIGSIVFGSGYVLLAFLRTEFVEHLHWLTEKQLIDAVAVGQFTPGPVFTTATFIGYVIAGIRGAAAATVGIFLPGFVLVALAGRVISKLRRSGLAIAILDGVVVGSLALMGVVTWQLARAAIMDWLDLAILIASAALLIQFRTNSAWIIFGAGIVGWVLKH
jgi:chromate transporter